MLIRKSSLTKSSNTTSPKTISKSTNTSSSTSSQSTSSSLALFDTSSSPCVDLVASTSSTSTISGSLDPALQPSTSRKHYTNSRSSACQTDSNSEDFSPLPLEINTKLYYYSRHKKFISSSLPSLYNVQWTTSDDLLDAAEEALAEQYDKQIQEFYEDEQDRIRKLKE